MRFAFYDTSEQAEESAMMVLSHGVCSYSIYSEIIRFSEITVSHSVYGSTADVSRNACCTSRKIALG